MWAESLFRILTYRGGGGVEVLETPVIHWWNKKMPMKYKKHRKTLKDIKNLLSILYSKVIFKW